MKNLNNPNNSKTISGLDQKTLLAVVQDHCEYVDVESFKWYYEVQEVCARFNIDSDSLSDAEWHIVADLIRDNLPNRFFN